MKPIKNRIADFDFKAAYGKFLQRLWERKWLFLIYSLVIVYFTISNFFSRKLIVLIAAAGLALIFFYTEKMHRNVFATILVMGTIFAFMTPVFDVPDEPVHFQRALYTADGHLTLPSDDNNYQISDTVNWMVETGTADITVKEGRLKFWDMNSRKLDDEKTNQINIKGTSAYSFVSYIPQALAINIGRLFGLPLGVLFLLGRLFNLLTYALLAALAVKIAPVFKEILSVVACIPISVYLSASYNQDAMWMGASLLIIAYFLRLVTGGEKSIGMGQVAVYCALCLLMIVTKLPYVCLAGLIIFIPVKKFKEKRYYLFTWLILLALAALTAAWFVYTTKFPSPYLLPEVEAAGQLRYILSEPFLFLQRIITQGVNFFLGFDFMFSFGWLTYSERFLFMAFLLFFGVLLAMFPKKKPLAGSAPRIGSAFVGIGIYFAVFASMYITWTAVGSADIQGVQGRYFIPLLPLAAISFNHYQKEEDADRNELKKKRLLVMCVSLCFIGAALMITKSRYYS